MAIDTSVLFKTMYTYNVKMKIVSSFVKLVSADHASQQTTVVRLHKRISETSELTRRYILT